LPCSRPRSRRSEGGLGRSTRSCRQTNKHGPRRRNRTIIRAGLFRHTVFNESEAVLQFDILFLCELSVDSHFLCLVTRHHPIRCRFLHRCRAPPSRARCSFRCQAEGPMREISGGHGRGRRRRGRMVHNATAYSCLRSMTPVTEKPTPFIPQSLEEQKFRYFGLS